MRKTSNKLSGMGWLAAASLAATLAAYGCTSNQYSGNGQPTNMTPMNHSTTYGSSSGTEGVQPLPMSSSYANPAARRVDVDALANLAAQQGFRGRVLGPSDPGGTSGVTIASGGFQSPADAVFPQATVNSSINSQPVPVITGGAAGAGITIANASTAGGATVTGAGTAVATTAAATTAPPTTAGVTAATAGTTVAGSQSFQSALMNSTPAPQATGTANRTLPTVVATGRATTTRSTAASSATRATSALTVTRSATGAVVATSPIAIQAGANGSVMMTNVPTTATVKGK